MIRFYKDYNPKDLPLTALNNLDWDIIELNIKVDENKIIEYYKIVQQDLKHLFFDFSYKDYLKPEIYEKYITESKVSNYVGGIGGWTISWPADRDIPCPGQYQAKTEMYPELDNCNFYYDAKPMNVYKFGYMKTLFDVLTEKSLRQALIARHPPGVTVLTHTDGPNFKLHIPLETNPQAFFNFGLNREREYHLELGKMYLINTPVDHGTDNFGTTPRTHLLSRVDMDFVPTLLAMTGTVY